LPFDPIKFDLPITKIIPEVREKLSSENTLIVHAPPGAGKSTLIPLALFEEPWLKAKKILMLEPRRLAAKSIASRMSFLLDKGVGHTAGYRIRFESRVSEYTRIEVVTEGILTRMLQSDNSLEEVGLVIFDEFHERSIHADVAMALCREAQQVLRPDLRILVMSATLDIPNLTTLLKANVVESLGRQYPVEIIYSGEQDLMMLPEIAVRTIIKAVNEYDGDALVFLPGEGEIRKCEEMLKKQLGNFAIHPLYGQLPFSKQQAAILPNKNGKRKIVLATPIAETSLTIEGVTIVVDSGFARTSKFDPNSGLTKLETIQIAKDSADQRAGRAGRLSPGVCYRMWSKTTQSRMADHRTPEIMEADLANLMLDMAQWGVIDIQQLTWISQPPKGHLSQASEILHQLDALENGRITEHGKSLHKLPCHPRIAHMLLKAKEDEMLDLACDTAAILEERDPLPKEAGIDINLRVEALRRFRKNNGQGSPFGRIEKVAASYRKLFNIVVQNDLFDPFETGIILAHAYPERIAHAQPGNNAQFKLANGKMASASHRDDLAHEAWLAIANINAREGMGKIFLAAPLNPKDLAPLVKETEVIKWDTDGGGLIATKDLRIGSIVLQSKPLPNPDELLRVGVISHAIKSEGERLLNFDELFSQWQNRVLSLRKWNPQDEWPDVSTSSLLITNMEWLSPYLNRVRKPEDLKKINLTEILQHSLDYDKQKLLDKLVPTKIEVPSGSIIKIEYLADGAAPILAVRLQEVFGLEDTPTINQGKTALLMHLQSPGFKLVQITGDLRSFWNNTYFEVKKDLKRRYPKHAWPDDPWTAVAVKGVKRKN
jgi:ATP-dependent helicase HrpB